MVDVKVRPFRVEWRPDLTTGWLLIQQCGSSEDADGVAEAALEAHRGYCRIVEQKVVASSDRPGERPVRADAPEGDRAVVEDLADRIRSARETAHWLAVHRRSGRAGHAAALLDVAWRLVLDVRGHQARGEKL